MAGAVAARSTADRDDQDREPDDYSDGADDHVPGEESGRDEQRGEDDQFHNATGQDRRKQTQPHKPSTSAAVVA